MKARNRFYMLIGFCVLFLIFAPYTVLYSLGYRLDIKNFKITATGGIYVKATPQQTLISIDSKPKATTSRFAGTTFIQGLPTGEHILSIAKNGYYNYQKNILITKNEVAKFENVLLFKKDLNFKLLDESKSSPFVQKIPQKAFTLENGNLYLTQQLATLQKAPALLTNVIAFIEQGNNIIWIGRDGFLYQSPKDKIANNKLSDKALTINLKKEYALYNFNSHILLKTGTDLYLFNEQTKLFENFYNPVKALEFSPKNQTMVFYNDFEILYAHSGPNGLEKIFFNRFSQQVSDVFWVNDNYIVFKLAEKIVVSELDSNQPNIIYLPQFISVSNINFDTKDAKIMFNQDDKKLYLLIGDSVIVSDPLFS